MLTSRPITEPMADACAANSLGSDGSAWYAVNVRYQHEKRTGQALEQRGWETFVPVYETERQWSDRIKKIEMPLFGGYVFCRFPLEERMRVEDTPGVVRVVRFHGAPAPLEPGEMERIQRLTASDLPLAPWPYLSTGDRVRVCRGPLRGLEGTLVEAPGRGEENGGRAALKSDIRLVVSVEMLQRSVAVQLEPGMIMPVGIAG